MMSRFFGFPLPVMMFSYAVALPLSIESLAAEPDAAGIEFF